jgi:hypothetical protein
MTTDKKDTRRLITTALILTYCNQFIIGTKSKEKHEALRIEGYPIQHTQLEERASGLLQKEWVGQ